MPFDVNDFIAGWVGGAAGVVSSHPLDTVKVRLQTSTAYKGTVDCVIKTFRKEGLRGFLKGMSFPLSSIAAYNAVVFGIYSNTTKAITQYRYNDPNRAPSYIDITMASMVAGGLSVAAGAPVDLVKIRLQAQTGKSTMGDLTRPMLWSKKKTGLLMHPQWSSVARSSSQVTTVTTTSVVQPEPYKGVSDCLLRIYKTDGLRGFYVGSSSMVVRDIPGYAMYFVPYAMLCDAFKNAQSGEPSAFGLIMAGGLAGVISWGFAHPMDTVKSRLQLQGSHRMGFFECAFSMYQKEGLHVFFRGIGVNALRGFPQSAALFFGYEMSMKALRS